MTEPAGNLVEVGVDELGEVERSFVAAVSASDEDFVKSRRWRR